MPTTSRGAWLGPSARVRGTLVVDLGDSDHASADLLTVLHGTAGRLRALGGRLGVVVTQPDLRRLLDLTLLSRGFAVFSTRDEALTRWG